MSGSNIVADTSFLINFFNGNKFTREFIEGRDIWISGITEIEILASPKISPAERKLVKEFISSVIVVDLLGPVKEIAVQIRLKSKIKLPDAVIAATALYLNFPLFSYDKGFQKITDLNLLLLEL